MSRRSGETTERPPHTSSHERGLSVLRRARDMVATYGHLDFHRSNAAWSGEFLETPPGICVGKALMVAAGPDFHAWATARQRWCDANGVQPEEGDGPPNIVEANDLLFEQGGDVLATFDRALHTNEVSDHA